MKNMEKMNIHLFRTCGNYYIYDVYNNVVLKVDDKTYIQLLHMQSPYELDLLNTVDANSVIGKLKNEGFLRTDIIKKIKHPMTDNVADVLSNDLHMLILQVTQNCNLRCKYCIYSGSYINRSHNNKRMDFGIAKKAIDYYIRHSSQLKKLRFGFYGGEPTLESSLINKCVKYITDQAVGREIEFNLTTNATMLNREWIDFFSRYGFYLTISLDGPEKIQDRNRVFAGSGEGTFASVKRNIEMIIREYPAYMKYVHFNVVMDPSDNYFQISEFFSKNPLVKDFNSVATEQNDVNYESSICHSEDYDVELAYERFKKIYCTLRNINIYNQPLVDGYLVSIKKNIADELKKDGSGLKEAHPGGPCVPGLQRLFVDVDGNMYPCERINETASIMRIGNVYDGIDFDRAKKLLNVAQISEEQCKSCWAFRFCTSCAVYAENGDSLSKRKRLQRCKTIQSNTEYYLKEYCALKNMKFDFSLLESNSEV